MLCKKQMSADNAHLINNGRAIPSENKKSVSEETSQALSLSL